MVAHLDFDAGVDTKLLLETRDYLEECLQTKYPDCILLDIGLDFEAAEFSFAIGQQTFELKVTPVETEVKLGESAPSKPH